MSKPNAAVNPSGMNNRGELTGRLSGGLNRMLDAPEDNEAKQNE